MSQVFIPPKSIAPPGLKVLLNKDRLDAKSSLAELDKCSTERNYCVNCPFQEQCYKAWQRLIWEEKITGWGNIGNHVY